MSTTKEVVVHLNLRVARLLPPQIGRRVNAAFTKVETMQSELEHTISSTEDPTKPAEQGSNGHDHRLEVQELLEKCDVAMKDAQAALEDASRIMGLIGSAIALAKPVLEQNSSSNDELGVPVADLPEIMATFVSLVAAWEFLVVERPERAASDETQDHTN